MEAVHTASARRRFKSSRCVLVKTNGYDSSVDVEMLVAVWSGTTSHAQLASLKKVEL